MTANKTEMVLSPHRNLAAGTSAADPEELADTGAAILQARGLRKAYGGLIAVAGFDIDLSPGEIVGLVGPNGSGKSTTLDLLCGVQSPDAGRLVLAGRDFTDEDPAAHCRGGLSRLFQRSRVFKSLTVSENLRVVAGPQGAPSEELVEYLLKRLGLADQRNRPAGLLSYGQQRLLDFGRALATTPRVVLLDEPTAGVNSRLVEQMAELVQRIVRKEQVSVLVVEHNVAFVQGVCNRLLAMADGTVIAQGAPQDVLRDERVISAYFGE